jgi:hypothetical protein
MRITLIALLFLCSLGNGLLYAQWYQYPTYQEYVGFLEKWQADYPQLAKLYNLGPSGQGTHEIYAMRISDNVDQNEAEPRFIQTATSRGDEVLNYMFTLHMIDTILTSYETDDRITRLVNSTELWFCPLLNPDATYRSGDHTVDSAVGSVGDFNLDANWPCPCMEGDNWMFGVYDSYAPETAALLSLHNMYRFNLQVDLHGRIECALYPYGAIPVKVCDEDWYKWAATRYVGQVWDDCGNNGYMTAHGDGVGHVYYDLYICHGTRSDFCARFAQAKGIRVATSVRGIVAESDLKKHWQWNKEALFQYYELFNTGIQGIVTDASTKKSIFNVKVSAVGHDYDNAEVNTDSVGFYLRFIEKGIYSLTFSHPDYYPKTIDSIVIDDYSKKYPLDVELDRITEIKNKPQRTDRLISIHRTDNRIKIVFEERLTEHINAGIYTVQGRLVHSFNIKAGEGVVGKSINIGLPGGCYFIRFIYRGNPVSERFVQSY